MRLYTMPLCRHFMLVLYTKVYTRFMPRVHRLALYQVDLQVGKRPRQPGRVRFRLRLRRRRGDRRRPPVGSVRKSGRPHRWGDFGQIPPGAGFPRSAGGGLGGPRVIGPPPYLEGGGAVVQGKQTNLFKIKFTL